MCVKFCNLRRRFCNYYGVKRVNIEGMLKNLGQEFDGLVKRGGGHVPKQPGLDISTTLGNVHMT